MKKTILTFVFVLIFATVANAAPRIGLIGEQENGLGLLVHDDAYSIMVTFGQRTDDSVTSGTDNSATLINAGLNYKVPINSDTKLTAGLSYTLYSGNVISAGNITATEHDGSNKLSVNAGFEHMLASNIVLTTQASAYTMSEIKFKSPVKTIKKSSIFTDGRVGVGFLF
jgi:hypothetical protein